MMYKRLAIAAALLSVMSGGFAGEFSPYVGVGVGNTRSHLQSSQLVAYSPNPCTSMGCNVDRSDRGVEIFVGAKIFRYLSAEVGYVDLGDTATFTTATTNTQQKTDGYRASVLGVYPINKFTVLARAGLYRWNSDIYAQNNLGTRFDSTASGTDLTYGFGLGYENQRHWGVRLMWDRFNDLGESSGALQTPFGPVRTVELDTDLVSLNLLFRF